MTNEEFLIAPASKSADPGARFCELNKDHPQANELFNPQMLPVFYDPFAGGGTIPLEAQRLGLEACASDLNPVAVLINKAMIEDPHHGSSDTPLSATDTSADKREAISGSRRNGRAQQALRGCAPLW